MMAMIYLVALLALFLILIIATIAVIAGRSRRRYDDAEEESEAGDDEIFQDADDMLALEDDIYVDNLDLDVNEEEDLGDDFEDSESVDTLTDEEEADEFDEEFEEDDIDDSEEVPADIDPIQPNAPTQELDTDAVKKEKNKQIESASVQEEKEAEHEPVSAEVMKEAEREPVSAEASATTEHESVDVSMTTAHEGADVSVTEHASEDAVSPTDAQATEDVTVSESTEAEPPKKTRKKQKRSKVPAETEDSAFAQQDSYQDSAFVSEIPNIELSNEAIAASVREAEAMGAAIMGDLKAAQVSAETMFGINEQLSSYGAKKNKRAKSKVSSDEEFYWYNKEDVAERPQRRPAEAYYHYFNIANDCIEDLLVEMYDCALVRTEEIRYIAYGIEPKTLSMKEIMSGAVAEEHKQKEPTTQDLVCIYEKWCGYVDHLFDKVEIHADEYTIEAIRKQLCEYGRNDVDVLLEGK